MHTVHTPEHIRPDDPERAHRTSAAIRLYWGDREGEGIGGGIFNQFIKFYCLSNSGRALSHYSDVCCRLRRRRRCRHECAVPVRSILCVHWTFDFFRKIKYVHCTLAELKIDSFQFNMQRAVNHVARMLNIFHIFKSEWLSISTESLHNCGFNPVPACFFSVANAGASAFTGVREMLSCCANSIAEWMRVSASQFEFTIKKWHKIWWTTASGMSLWELFVRYFSRECRRRRRHSDFWRWNSFIYIFLLAAHKPRYKIHYLSLILDFC